nr:hypothetical protein [Tanacetum cinerariifolium]
MIMMSWVENAKVKKHYKELYDTIKITRAKHIDQTTAVLTENENLKVQINAKLKFVTIDSVTPKVLAPGMYAIDVEPNPPRLRNNRKVHLDYLNHLKESVATLCEIVEEANVERPLGRSATTPLNRKKQVTFVDQCETLNTNTQKHVEQQITQKTNVLVLPSTGVDSCTDASGSKPRSNTKKNKILPAKSVNKKTVEDHSRTNKSYLQKPNRVDSSISSKRTVINLNSDSVCQTCNKCFILANHDMCVIKYLSSVNAPSSTKTVMRKVKYQCRNKQNKAVPVGIPTSTDATMQSAIAYANKPDSNQNWRSNFPNSPSLSVFKCRSYRLSFDTMADMNIPANDAPAEQAPAVAPPTKIDNQNFLVLFTAPTLTMLKGFGKSLFNPIVVALLKNTNFFRAFTASFTISAIYIQQFWDTMCFNTSTGLYSCQLDEQWFNLHKDLLIDALDITPPSSDTVIEYVNTLGYPSTLKNVSAMSVNALYQPWKAILSMINMCLTDFVQSIQTFLTDRKNLATASHGKKKTTHLLISSVRFTKLIIHHLKTKHNIYPRSGSPLYYLHNENVLNTLRYVGKDGREIFGMPIPNALLTDKVKGEHYYDEYQEHVAKYQQYLDVAHGKAEEREATESPKATKVTKPKAAKVTKPASDPKPKTTPTQPSKAVPKKKQKLVQETPNEP